jgi:hypothetical protein
MIEMPEESIFTYVGQMRYLARTGAVISLVRKQLACRMDDLVRSR